MPFYYFGGKSAIAKHYPAPMFDTIVEPFAGAAGYSLHYAVPEQPVIIIEKDERIADLWVRLQHMTADDLWDIDCPPVGERTTEPLIVLAACCQTRRILFDQQVTTRQALKWPPMRRKLLKALPLIKSWTVLHGDALAVAPDIEATWFVDPPYQVSGAKGTNGDGYREGSSAIDYAKLGEWCRSRRGQMIVCEQLGATWLPFEYLTEINTTTPALSRRTEVMWTNRLDRENDCAVRGR